MANKNLITFNSKAVSVEQVYYSPVAVLPISGIAVSTTYAFIAHANPWTYDTNPETPTQTQAYIKNVFKNMIALKKITTNDISPVITRIDWKLNTIYTYYQDNIDMFTVDSTGALANPFYVRNSYDQVFKCLWNNNGAPSTVMPFFQPGNYGSNYIFQGSDGYKWKYIYTVTGGIKRTFMDTTWMPVPVGQNNPGPVLTSGVQTGAWAGDIEVINVTNGGTGYSNIIPITVTITGDGLGAAGYAQVSANGSITNIIVTNTGTNYSYANVSITSVSGSGATAIAPTSPIGGHGYDPVSELGCNHVMYNCQFNGSDLNNVIPTDIDYHQIGLVINPIGLDTYPAPANGAIYAAYTQLVVAPGFGTYLPDEILYQGSSLSTASYVGTVLNFNSTTNIITLINITGTPTLSTSIYGSTSTTVRTLLTVNSPTILLPSGYLSYIENRSAIQRSASGIEQLRLVLGY
jgi:hypothetical protein